jgi:hypothetical protein
MEIVLVTLTVVSLIVATVMSVIVRRIRREERRRSEARVEALASALYEAEGRREAAGGGGRPESARLQPVAARRLTLDDDDPRPARIMSRPAEPVRVELFEPVQSENSRSRLANVLTVGTVAVSLAVALIVVTSRRGSSDQQVAAPAPTSQSVATAPLELVALGHERDAERITVRGMVRNPLAGQELRNVQATVFLLSPEGTLLTSGRAAIANSVLAPGAESAFVVTMPDTGKVGRYRVSFRLGDKVLSHVDQRGQGSVAKLK